MTTDEFLTLENALKYNEEQNKLFYIADELDISPQGNKVLAIEGKLIEILQAHNITLKD